MKKNKLAFNTTKKTIFPGKKVMISMCVLCLTIITSNIGFAFEKSDVYRKIHFKGKGDFLVRYETKDMKGAAIQKRERMRLRYECAKRSADNPVGENPT